MKDGKNEGWYGCLKSLPEIVRGSQVRFSVVDRQFQSLQVPHHSFYGGCMVNERVIADDITDADTLLKILLDESIKAKSIAELDVQDVSYYGMDEHFILKDIVVAIVESAAGDTNIDADVMDCFARVFLCANETTRGRRGIDI